MCSSSRNLVDEPLFRRSRLWRLYSVSPFFQPLPTIWENIYVTLMGVVSVWEIVSQKTDMLERRRPISTTRYHLFMKVLKVQVLSKVQHKIILSGTKNERSLQVIPFFYYYYFTSINYILSIWKSITFIWFRITKFTSWKISFRPCVPVIYFSSCKFPVCLSSDVLFR